MMFGIATQLHHHIDFDKDKTFSFEIGNSISIDYDGEIYDSPNGSSALEYLSTPINKGSVVEIYVDRVKGNIAFSIGSVTNGFAKMDVDFIKKEALYLTMFSNRKDKLTILNNPVTMHPKATTASKLLPAVIKRAETISKK